MDKKVSGVVVIGSMTADVTAIANTLPRGGETVLGEGLTLVSGGKGSNQAAMASRMGMNTWMVGCVGTDAFQSIVLDSLRDHGVNTDFVDKLDNEKTGVAHIRVDRNGNNDIVIVPMANNRTNPERVDRFFDSNPNVNTMLLQLEIPVPTVMYAAKEAKKRGLTVIFDPAPAAPFPDELYKYVDIVTPNETETTVLTGIEVTDVATAKTAAQVLLDKGVKLVIITLAEKGVLIADGKSFHHLSSFDVEVVDSTAAGDAFTGTLGACVSQGKTIEESVQYAMAAGALTVTKSGAQTSLPNKEEITLLMKGGCLN
ncbi:ribokinase [Heyndrickxia acidicola]|uniref:Ribokinase n=1 Tax=Heyndrickxia acidicola TaxID=209389 RepID=A0ABU6MKL5_9BACI|nr:ribokinase [Heyndrickxia acidicola]MED1204193.1 ribokinase [Heyndrickxia acidicola]